MNRRTKRKKPAPLCGPNQLKIVAKASLPTGFGKFAIVAFCNTVDGKEHIALVKGKVKGKPRVLTRMHSECLTGDALCSMRCDCRQQLLRALAEIEANGSGVLLYLRQEGRGIGLTNKIRAYELQDAGLDTVEANHALGFEYDLRDYAVPAMMLELLGVKSVRLLTNNPEKVDGLEKSGVKVAAREPLEIAPGAFNKKYLQTKKTKLGHYLRLRAAP
jgi:3,4-dihydroxy 2-butanone 4-phosphate synthase / GTP cyclohydrolase II